MPKRTNDFQELIAIVYEQITPEGGIVTESGMVFDKDAKELREVDILVECRYAHHDFKLVIECRDRSRKESVEWIDGLIGKAESLNINKVVAVSSKGFTKSALKKAQAHGIDALSIEEAVKADWDKYFIKPAVIVITEESFRLYDVLFKDGEHYRSLKELNLDSVLLVEGQVVGSLKEAFNNYFLNSMLPNIKNYVQSERHNLFKMADDLSKVLSVESEELFPGATARLNNGDIVDISSLKFIVFGTRQYADVKQTHVKFNELLVSTGQHLDPDGTVFKFTIVQDPETKKLHVKSTREKPVDISNSALTGISKMTLSPSFH